MRFDSLPKIVSAGAFVLLLLHPILALGNSLTDATQLRAEGAAFSWEEARERSVKIVVQRRGDEAGTRSSIGSGFLISSDGLFVTAYHVMKYCLGNNQGAAGFSVAVDCSKEHPKVEYRAQNNGQEYEIEIISYLKLQDSVKAEVQTPDETMKLKDFVIGRLKAPAGAGFPYWQLNEFNRQRSGDRVASTRIELRPLVPPKKVFVAGYSAGPEFSLTQG